MENDKYPWPGVGDALTAIDERVRKLENAGENELERLEAFGRKLLREVNEDIIRQTRDIRDSLRSIARTGFTDMRRDTPPVPDVENPCAKLLTINGTRAECRPKPDGRCVWCDRVL